MASRIELGHMNDYFDRFSALVHGDRETATEPAGGQRIIAAPHIGEGSMTRIPIRQGMEVVITDMLLKQDMKLQVCGSHSIFELNYCLDGEIYCAWDGHEHFTGRANGNLFYMEDMQLYMEKKGGVRTRTVELRLSPEELLRYVDGTSDYRGMEQMLKRYRGKFVRYEDTPSIQRCIYDLFHIQRQGTMKRLYAESKTMELIALIAQEGSSDGAKELKIALSADDVRKLDEAKKLVMLRLDQPLTLRELGNLVGMNEYKLKKGFREVYGMTIFELVRQERMKLALQLMDAEGMNVSETAAWLGYSNMSNFTAAFRKQYGVNPSQYMKELNRRLRASQSV